MKFRIRKTVLKKSAQIFSVLILASLLWLAPVLFQPEIPEVEASSAGRQITCGPGMMPGSVLGFWECRNYDNMDGCVNLGNANGYCDWANHGYDGQGINVECWKYTDGCVPIPYSPPAISGVVNCTQPGLNGWCAGGLTLQLSASDPQGFPLNISGNINGAAFACPGGNTCARTITGTGNGTAAYSVSSSSGLSASGSTTYKLDPLAPNIQHSVSGTLGLNDWHTTRATLTASAGDSVSGLRTFIIRDNDAPVSSPVSLSDGVHFITLSAMDNAGNVANQSLTLNVDTLAPVMGVSRAGTLGDGGWYTSAIDFQITAIDSGSGVERGEYRIDGGSWRVGMSFTVSSDGPHDIEYRVFDNAGNVTSASETVQIDATRPVVIFHAPSANTPVDKIVPVSGASSDALSRLVSVEVSVDEGKTWKPLTKGAWAYNWDVSGLDNGAHSILVRARDTAGNLYTASLPLLVDNEGPLIEISEPWTFDLAGELKISANAHLVASVTVTVTNSAGVQIMETRYTEKFPSVIWWDGRYQGELQPAGEYIVTVTACDIYGVCTTQRSKIIIPAFYFITPAPTAVEIKTPPPPVIVIPPTRTPVVIEKPKPPVTPEPSQPAVKPTNKGAMTAAVSAGFGLLFFFIVIFDRRSKAMNNLAASMRKHIKE
jgi:hypothetical protein